MKRMHVHVAVENIPNVIPAFVRLVEPSSNKDRRLIR